MSDAVTTLVKPEINLLARLKHLSSVSILGKCNTGLKCPWTTDEVWGVNNVADQPEYESKKFDRLFAFDLLPPEYTDGMKKHAPIVSWQPYADIPYPLQEAIEAFDTKFFTNTISYTLALCALAKIPRIELYGIDVSFGAPYVQENRGIEYWIGRCVGRGLDVRVTEGSHLLRTISGKMYGEIDHTNVMLYLHERINLLNILPKTGHYSDMLKAQNAFWVLMVKDDEAKAHGVTVQPGPAGQTNFQAPQEFQSDVQMPPEAWTYVRKLLIDMEATGTRPQSCLTLYDKLVLSWPPEHN